MKADSGSISIAATKVSELSESEKDRMRAKTLGYVFQSFHLLQGCTALENILVAMALAGNASDQRARELLFAVGMSERENHLPAQLSIGQQQRVGIARALANDPKLILADEPTGNLDGATGQAIMDLLFGLRDRHGCTLVLVTHAPELAARCDRTIRLADGRLAQGQRAGSASAEAAE